MDKWIKDVEKHNSKAGVKGLSQHLLSKRLEVLSMLRTVLSKCDHKAVKADVILDDLLQFLSPSVAYLRTKKTFGEDILEILRCEILSSKIFRQKIRVEGTNSSNQWKTLLTYGFEQLKSGNLSTSTLDFNYKVIRYGCQFSNLWANVRNNFGLIENMFQNFEDLLVRNSTTETKVAALKLINAVQEVLQREARILLCKFGEAQGLNILAMNVPERTDDLVIDFFNVQMRLHHPLGGPSAKEGALIIDTENWNKTLLPRIFDRLIVNTIHHSQRYNRHRRDYTYAIKETFLDLALRLAKQIFLVSDEVSDTPPIGDVEPPAAKRSRLELNFNDGILARLKHDSSKEKEETIIPWLQILNGLIGKVRH